MLENTCIICQKVFLRKQSQILLGGGKFCSNACRFIGKRRGKSVLCYVCGTEVYRQKKQLNASKSGKFFCTKKCLLAWIFEKHDGKPNLKYGTFSYRDKLLREGNINAECFLCSVSDIRMLAVHHIDKNRKNNSLMNLTWLCHNCHFLVHYFESEQKMLSEKIKQIHQNA